jgi:hypothetical protein
MGEERFGRSLFEPWENFGGGEKYIDGVSKNVGELVTQYFRQFLKHELSQEEVELRLANEIKTALTVLIPPGERDGT